MRRERSLGRLSPAAAGRKNREGAVVTHREEKRSGEGVNECHWVALL
jgi:hypothetical protein